MAAFQCTNIQQILPFCNETQSWPATPDRLDHQGSLPSDGDSLDSKSLLKKNT